MTVVEECLGVFGIQAKNKYLCQKIAQLTLATPKHPYSSSWTRPMNYRSCCRRCDVRYFVANGKARQPLLLPIHCSL